jgi:[ribosomal protein S18]-alanine N-acetyltransferase
VTPGALAATHAAAFEDERAWTEAEFAGLLAQPGVILCGTPRSFALGRVTLDDAEVLTLATVPAARRQGLARAALVALTAGAARAGAVRMFLEVAEDNLAAIALYHSCGFLQVGRRPGYYARLSGPKVAALVMEKALGPG